MTPLSDAQVATISNAMLRIPPDSYSPLHRFITQCQLGNPQTIVSLGGSITAGTASSDAAHSWVGLVNAWLAAQYPSVTFTKINVGIGSTGSWYGLSRLQTDVLSHSPNLVTIDFAVNDFTNAWDQPSAEALIRRIGAAFPDAAILCVFFFSVADKNVDNTTNTHDASYQWWKSLAAKYKIPYADYCADIQAIVAGGGHLSTYFSDTVHPNDAGHAEAAALVESVLSSAAGAYPALDWASYLYANSAMLADTANYLNTPIARNGTDNDGETGAGWSTSSTSRVSSTAGATIKWTGTFQSFGLDTLVGAGTGVIQWDVDGGGYSSNYDLTAQGQTYQPLWSASRASHTVTFKVISGTVTFRRFLAI